MWNRTHTKTITGHVGTTLRSISNEMIADTKARGCLS
jgi:hypothetical protein